MEEVLAMQNTKKELINTFRYRGMQHLQHVINFDYGRFNIGDAERNSLGSSVNLNLLIVTR